MYVLICWNCWRTVPNVPRFTNTTAGPQHWGRNEREEVGWWRPWSNAPENANQGRCAYKKCPDERKVFVCGFSDCSNVVDNYCAKVYLYSFTDRHKPVSVTTWCMFKKCTYDEKKLYVCSCMQVSTVFRLAYLDVFRCRWPQRSGSLRVCWSMVTYALFCVDGRVHG